MADKFKIELHGSGSGLLDWFTGPTEAGMRKQLVDKLESGDWIFRNGDTLKFVTAADGAVYIIADKTASNPDGGMLKAYRRGYDSFMGNWTWLRPLPSGQRLYETAEDRPMPQTWKTEAGAIKAMANMPSKPERVVMWVRLV